jgi:hypothetical protein
LCHPTDARHLPPYFPRQRPHARIAPSQGSESELQACCRLCIDEAPGGESESGLTGQLLVLRHELWPGKRQRHPRPRVCERQRHSVTPSALGRLTKFTLASAAAGDWSCARRQAQPSPTRQTGFCGDIIAEYGLTLSYTRHPSAEWRVTQSDSEWHAYTRRAKATDKDEDCKGRRGALHCAVCTRRRVSIINMQGCT